MVSAKLARRQDLEKMKKTDCAGNRNLSETLARLPRILPYCSRPVTIVFMYARCWSLIPRERRNLLAGLSRKLTFWERAG